MSTLSRFALALGYLTFVAAIWIFHAYALHLDEAPEAEPTPVAQRQA